MRDERNHIIQMNGMNGPLLVGACGGGIPVAPVAMVPVVSVGAINSNDQGNQCSRPNVGNGSADCKYDEKKKINLNQGQNKNINRKLPPNGAQRMTFRPIYNTKPQPQPMRNPVTPLTTATGPVAQQFRPQAQNCLNPYLPRYPTQIPAAQLAYGTYPPSPKQHSMAAGAAH